MYKFEIANLIDIKRADSLDPEDRERILGQIYIYVYAYIHTQVYIYIYICVCIYIYIYIYIYEAYASLALPRCLLRCTTGSSS